MRYEVKNCRGEVVDSFEVASFLVQAKTHMPLVHDAVVWQRNKRRAGTHSCLSRGVMKGGGRKPWRQKGTGRARAGSNVSPLWVGGGVAHGPKPRDYTSRVSKRARRLALLSVLGGKIRSSQLIVLDDLSKVGTKTKQAAQTLHRLCTQSTAYRPSVGGLSAVFLLRNSEAESGALECLRAIRNLPHVLPLPLKGINTYDLLRHKFLVTSRECLEELQRRLAAKDGLEE